jgi:hypothetical protein
MLPKTKQSEATFSDDKIKKTEHTKGTFLRQLGHLHSRPAAFRPLLTEGMALSGESLATIFIYNLPNILVCQLE